MLSAAALHAGAAAILREADGVAERACVAGRAGFGDGRDARRRRARRRRAARRRRRARAVERSTAIAARQERDRERERREERSSQRSAHGPIRYHAMRTFRTRKIRERSFDAERQPAGPEADYTPPNAAARTVGRDTRRARRARLPHHLRA